MYRQDPKKQLRTDVSESFTEAKCLEFKSQMKKANCDFFPLLSISKALIKAGRLEDKAFSKRELRLRWLADRDVLLSLVNCYAPEKMKKTSQPVQFWMLRAVGETVDITDPDSGPADVDSKCATKKKRHTSAAAWADYFVIPSENVITLSGERSKYRTYFTEEETLKKFAEERNWDAYSEYNETVPEIVADDKINDIVASETAAMRKRLQSNELDFNPVVLFVYGHFHADSDSIGANTATDIITKLRLLNLMPLMSQTVAIIGLSCNSINIVKELATAAEFSNALMAAGTTKVLVPTTRNPFYFNKSKFYFYSYDHEKRVGERRHQPLISDLQFSFKTYKRKKDIKNRMVFDFNKPFMGPNRDIISISRSMLFYEEEIAGLITLIHAKFEPKIATIILDYFAFLSTERLLSLSDVKPDDELIAYIVKINKYENILNNIPEKKIIKCKWFATEEDILIAAEMKRDALQKKREYIKKAVNRLFECMRNFIHGYSGKNLGIEPSEDLNLLVPKMLDYVCEELFNGVPISFKIMIELKENVLAKYENELKKAFYPYSQGRRLF